MKKIVALVLSLALALSLCTVAFAASTTTDVYNLDGGKHATTIYAKDVDYVKASSNHKTIGYYTWVEYDVDDAYCYIDKDGDEAIVSKTFYDNEIFAKGLKDKWDAENVQDWVWVDANDHDKGVVVKADQKFYFDVYGIPCEQSDADKAVHENGRMETYVYLTTDYTEVIYDKTATAQAATSAKPNCTVTQYKEDGYVDGDGLFYISVAKYTSNTKLYVDGKIVYAVCVDNDDDYVIHASHIFAKGVKNTKTGYDVATCLICKGEFACTNNDVVATKNGYKVSTGFSYYVDDAAKVYDANKYENGYDFSWGQTYANDYKFCWQLKAGTTEEIGTKPATDKKTGVDSAKTFDAGIAMYVGMSLLSVAGSAVVIGKKKEF